MPRERRFTDLYFPADLDVGSLFRRIGNGETIVLTCTVEKDGEEGEPSDIVESEHISVFIFKIEATERRGKPVTVVSFKTRLPLPKEIRNGTYEVPFSGTWTPFPNEMLVG